MSASSATRSTPAGLLLLPVATQTALLFAVFSLGAFTRNVARFATHEAAPLLALAVFGARTPRHRAHSLVLALTVVAHAVHHRRVVLQWPVLKGRLQQLIHFLHQFVRVADVHREHRVLLAQANLHHELAREELVPQGDSCSLCLLVNESKEEDERLLWWLLELPPGAICPPLCEPLELITEPLEVQLQCKLLELFRQGSWTFSQENELHLILCGIILTQHAAEVSDPLFGCVLLQEALVQWPHRHAVWRQKVLFSWNCSCLGTLLWCLLTQVDTNLHIPFSSSW